MVDTQFDELQLFDGQVHAEGLKPSEMEVLRNDLLKREDVASAVIAGSYSAIAVNGHDTLEETVNVQVFEKPEMIQSCYELRTRIGHEPLIPDNEGVIINEKLAENLGLQAGDTIIVESKTGIRKEVRISAVTEMYIQHYMFMTQQYYAKVFGSTISQDTLMVDIAGDVQVSRAFQKEIVNDDRVSGVQFYDTILENFKSMVNSLDLIVWALIISSMSLAFVVLGNLTNINISERQREIATLKVLGFRKKEVEDYIFKENNVLTGLGALAGIPIGQVLHHFIMRQVEMDYVMFGRSVAVSSNILSVLLTVLFGMLVNFFMRKKLQAIEMVESLKSVE
jgi:putative ABC transport system permease protein